MNEPLYTLDVLRLAAESGGLVRLDSFDASASRRAPLCGSSVTIDLSLADGVIAAVGGEVRACAFGQASTALFARDAVGRSAADIASARAGLAEWLGERGAPSPNWPGIEALAPARFRTARHGAMLLPFDAALAALAVATASA